MNFFYKRIDLPNITEIIKELSKEVPHGNITQSKPFDYHSSKNKFPILVNYINSISKVPLNDKCAVKIFVTASKNKGLIHSDYDSTSRIGLNIPISGCKSTEFIFYSTCKNNLKEILSDETKGYAKSFIPKNVNFLKIEERLELLYPYLIRTDIFHQSVNLTNYLRIIATVRWEPYRHLENFDDFIIDEIL